MLPLIVGALEDTSTPTTEEAEVLDAEVETEADITAETGNRN
jgi:hypothetical protein